METACEMGNGDKIISTQEGIIDLSTFILERVISCYKKPKTICLEGTFSGRNGKALLLIERKAINFEGVKKLLSNNCVIKKIPNSEFYECLPDAELCSVKAMLVFPATDKHIKKFEPQPLHIIRETPELYRNVTLPSLVKSSFNLQWVYNIFDHKAEQKSIIYEDLDPTTGFLLLPDLKWNQNTVDNLYILAIARPRGIKSLRDITAEHLPLLQNIKNKGLEVIKQKYGLDKSQLRIYVHYQPSYYHFHVHFTNVNYGAPGITTFKSHLLDTVIDNLEMVPDYYQRVVLTYTVKEGDILFFCFKEKGLVKELPPPIIDEEMEWDSKEDESVGPVDKVTTEGDMM